MWLLYRLLLLRYLHLFNVPTDGRACGQERGKKRYYLGIWLNGTTLGLQPSGQGSTPCISTEGEGREGVRALAGVASGHPIRDSYPAPSLLSCFVDGAMA